MWAKLTSFFCRGDAKGFWLLKDKGILRLWWPKESWLYGQRDCG